ncbi:hypothetical protein M0R45_022544 [Rubus argutus]|uniref:B box-type domain-containing protein n=1 Tax=Rubus argutus TaxID=59490 RepID=A0AAW1XGV6_RUBAR
MRQTIEDKRLQASKTEKGHMVVPQWLKIMCGTAFFRACIQHPDAKRNDLDHFCIDCLQPSCLNCLAQHPFHKNVKIRRYVYSDVINRRDLYKLFDCSGIQTYFTNRAKVEFARQFPLLQCCLQGFSNTWKRMPEKNFMCWRKGVPLRAPMF